MLGAVRLQRKIDSMISTIRNDAPKAIETEVQDLSAKAHQNFATAPYDGVNDVVVAFEPGQQNEWRIVASGTKVLFIEYGTGLRYRHDSEFGDFSMYDAGSWSATHSRFLFEPKWRKWRDWWPVPGYGPVLGNPSANIMYETRKTLQTMAPLRAKQAIDKAVRS